MRWGDIVFQRISGVGVVDGVLLELIVEDDMLCVRLSSIVSKLEGLGGRALL